MKFKQNDKVCIALWEILLKGRFPFLDQWLDFLDVN